MLKAIFSAFLLMWSTQQVPKFLPLAEIQIEEAKLLDQLHARIDELEALLNECSGKWSYEDPIYRFYHQSLKVYYVQETTRRIADTLQSLAPHLPLNDWFAD